MKQKLNQFKKEAEIAAEKEALQLSPHGRTMMEENKFINLGKYWVLIRLALHLVMMFTGKKADAKIREAIAWGDALFLM